MSGPDRVAIVTGSARGLGRDIARRLLDDGWGVIASDIDPGVLTEFAAPRARVMVTDAAAADSGTRLVAEAVAGFGRLDAVINNAGVGGPSNTVEQTPLEQTLAVLEVNLFGAIRLVQAALPVLRDSPHPRIVNIGSLFADRPVVNGSAYCMSKAALRSLGQCLALELGPSHVTVNTVAPGFMSTRMHEEEVAAQARERGIGVDQRMHELRDEVPLRRHGTGHDVAGAVAWLLSPDASYVTGQTIAVNGGVALS